MTQLTQRAEMFRKAIADFIEARREAKLKGKEEDVDAATKSASKYEYATWLADAASRAHNLQVVTHPIKFTHASIKGASSVHIGSANLPSHIEIGTHSVGALEEDFGISDSKHLDVYSLLKEVVEEKRLLDWLRDDDADFSSALDDDPAKAALLMDAFRRVVQPNDKITSHQLAKQIYWLMGEDPSEDSQYHLLQPMFSSSLEHVIHQDIRKNREAAFAARGTRKEKPTFADHSTYPGLVARTIGGSNAQNVSPQNKVRGGVNYLLPSLPPPAWKSERSSNLLKRESALEEFFWFGNVRELIASLIQFLRTNPDRTMETRTTRETIEQALGQELAMFGATLRAHQPAGWTRSEECRLQRCERLWLDSDRTELPERNDPEHPEWRADDIAFNEEYKVGGWADEVAERFGQWLNARLRNAGLVTMAEPERRHWTKQAIIDVAWPAPMQRFVRGDAT